jgi:bifunctional DNA-binding transcriptional regulator/antitoxin component of YhaV-PrlF toxin-antitoxin module
MDRNMGKYEFDARIIKHEGLDAGYVEFPYVVEKEFGKKGQVKVKAFFDGLLYRGSLVKMGHDRHIIGLTKEVRKKIGKNPGDMVLVIIEEDLEERTVEIPAELLERLSADGAAMELFEKLSYTHRKEYVQWIMSAKKEKTRIQRMEKAIEMIKNKIKEP